MSERKVLNKYYPPDFDPSQIPRSKEPRNKTFTIRLMAPCNMRCTTCGEYIYKGRKFNARKVNKFNRFLITLYSLILFYEFQEDVDDMNHLGLRIYRFYIKCTACLSEISFRTDPANTDYVLEAGATRNFEALTKAEKQAEEEERLRKEELENNPMKLLEERTEASKNEMARMEALEELQELNKREVKVDYENMLVKYEKLRQMEQEKQQKEDDEFVNKVFGRGENQERIKRIVDEDEEDEEESRRKKVKTVEKATDHLVEEKKEKKKEAWEKSVGLGLGSSKMKMGLGIVVKKKVEKKEETKIIENGKGNSETLKSSEDTSKSSEGTSKSSGGTPTNTGLSLLGAYSDSEEDSS